MQYNAKVRNIIGDIGAFCLGLLFNIMALSIIIIIEEYQCGYGKYFPLEKDDIIRRAICIFMASICQMIILGILVQ